MPGNTSASALFRSAESARTKQVTLEDDIAAFNWQSSDQTNEDYQTYRQFLETRSTSTVDPIKRISYQNKAVSAQRAFASNEIQRSAIDVLEGRGSLQDKQTTVLQLYKDALSNGDMNLAQNLRNQYDTIDVELQNQATAAAAKMKSAAEDMARLQVTNLKDLAKKYVEGDSPEQASTDPSIKQMVDLYKTQGSDKINELFTTADGTQFNFWDKVYYNVYKAAEALQLAANTATTDAQAETLYNQAADIINGKTKYDVAGVSVGVTEILDAADAARNGQNYFQPGKDAKGNNTFIKTKITNLLWARDTAGNLRIVETRDQISPLSSKITDPNDPTKKITIEQNIKNRLAEAGYEFIGTDENGGIQIRQTTNSATSEPIPGSTVGEQFVAFYDPLTNSLRFKSEQQDPNNPQSRDLFAINLNAGDPLFGKISKVDANAETFFGTNGIPNSTVSDAGARFLNVVLNPPVKPNAVFDNSLLGYNANTTDQVLLQGQNAANAQKAADRLQAATQASLSLQSNLPNGTSINQLAVPAGARLEVKPLPAPKPVSVTATPAAPPITVTPTPAQPQVTVAAPTPQPKVTVK